MRSAEDKRHLETEIKHRIQGGSARGARLAESASTPDSSTAMECHPPD
jgi:hypothetical protein